MDLLAEYPPPPAASPPPASFTRAAVAVDGFLMLVLFSAYHNDVAGNVIS
jgi:hypothetical protein